MMSSVERGSIVDRKGGSLSTHIIAIPKQADRYIVFQQWDAGSRTMSSETTFIASPMSLSSSSKNTYTRRGITQHAKTCADTAFAFSRNHLSSLPPFVEGSQRSASSQGH
uniref:Uncharacterized protein n=1 Tax=Panagrellus redivivus TaxID=6233 RepID=A0A7E4V1N2_PANRE